MESVPSIAQVKMEILNSDLEQCFDSGWHIYEHNMANIVCCPVYSATNVVHSL